MNSAPLPLSRIVPVAHLPPDGLLVDVVASEEELRAVAAHLRIEAVASLVAGLRVLPWSDGGARVVGELVAAVVQACVVTLDPVEQRVVEPIDVRFSPDVDAPAGGEITIDPDAPDPPDPLVGGTVDVGDLVVEHLALGLDPYPRKDGVTFAAEEAGLAVKPDSPFAALRDWAARREGRD